jgi:hypothetical protein
MITKDDLKTLYTWAKTHEFKLIEEPTSVGYPSKPILYDLLKVVRNSTIIRKKHIKDEEAIKILSNSDILFSAYVSIQSGTEHGPHKDLDVYKEEFKRIQIPVKIPDQENCYMIWKGNKITWEEGIPQVYEVMDYIHEGYNYSDTSMEFLFLDVKKNTYVEI